jgi:hypothetical protein
MNGKMRPYWKKNRRILPDKFVVDCMSLCLYACCFPSACAVGLNICTSIHELVRHRLAPMEYWYSSTKKWLCKIWGFHRGDYEECRLLGYKNPIRTSQETHYVSATEISRLMLCKIWGFHGGDYEECRLLGYKTQFVPHRKHITSLVQSPAG